MTHFFSKYRNLLLLALLVVTLLASYMVNQDRYQHETTAVSVPVVQTTPIPGTGVELFRRQREETAQSDIAALTALCEQELLDQETREDAARRLTALVEAREAQCALEAALQGSGVSPCVAVVTKGSVTLVTEKAELTAQEQALVLTLAKAHAGVGPSGVRVVCAKSLE